MNRIGLATGRVAWWNEVPLRWRLFFLVSPYIPTPRLIWRRGIHAEVDACHRWLASREAAR